MVIAVMGVTGSGKSTFVRTASGNNEVVVGHTLEASGSAVNEELHRLEAKYSAELKRIHTETAKALAKKDTQYKKILEAKRTKTEQRLERIYSDQVALHQERQEEMRRIVADNQRHIGLLQKEGGGERSKLGSRFVQLVASGTAAAITPLAIPVALASLANFMSSAGKVVLEKKGYKKG
ncbi:P-loop containing protein [Fusarium mexicanum]|uniref:P-loop containing protein n=1 Tax=Fusarium mexicanum TaxID=751941 RepID=A0A8H5IZA1_9HYPO|nr:P-loop containing protein [Fusarium mexicanum]